MVNLDGSLDNIVDNFVEGWACNKSHPNDSLPVTLFIDGKFVTNSSAEHFREDLKDADIGNGFHAFRIPIPAAYLDGAKHVIDVRVGDNSLPHSPRSMLLKGDASASRMEATVKEPASLPEPEKTTPKPEDEVARVVADGFSREFYLACYPDIREAGIDPVEHYNTTGWREGRDPHPEFSTHYYLDKNPDIREAGVNPFWHFLVAGRLEGRVGKPAQASAGEKGAMEAEFDREFYLEHNPDIKAAGIDPFEHFVGNGWTEGRNPSLFFDVNFYRTTHQLPPEINPLLHYVQEGKAKGLKTHPYRVREGYCIHDDIRYFAAPGPLHEKRDTSIVGARKPKAKALAFYLPQFHAIPENDEWWGVGFTEWRNIARGVPRYKGHYQPRIPEELGHYNLTMPGVMKQQVEMAKQAGLEGFCFYYYWFNGKRVLEKPLDAFLEDKSLDFSFSILWANENWTRRWDGFDKDVLLGQDYHEGDDMAFLADMNRYFADERYVKVDGRPLFTIYRPGIIPDAKETIARWRRLWKSEFNIEPVIMMVLGFGAADPGEYGLDGAIEFPPHKIAEDVPHITDQLEVLDQRYTGYAVSYDALVDKALATPKPNFPVLRGATPSWDNDARRQGRGTTYHGSTPQRYEEWLRHITEYAQKNPFYGESIVFINAWNEWAEAAYLEPDVHFGGAYLNATARALTHRKKYTEKEKVVVFTHDAYPHGAQLLVLHMAKTLKQQFGVEVAIVVLGDGPLVETYKEVAPTYQASHGDGNLAEIFDSLRDQGFRKALVNTTVSGRVIPYLKDRGFSVISLVHELPRLIHDYHLEPNLEAIAEHADTIIFAARQVRDGFLSIAKDCDRSKCIIRPQGNYKPWISKPELSAEIRKKLGVGKDDKIVLNVGYADSRKGFDIFQNVARLICRLRNDIHFVWLGAATQDIQNWLLSDTDEEAPEAGHFHMLPFTDDPVPVYEASDLFFLSSREDPFPTVVLEAMRAGLPLVGLHRSGGSVDVIEKFGKLAHRSDIEGIAEAITSQLDASPAERRIAARKRVDTIEQDFRFDDYMFDLLKLFLPELRKVSVVVPNYNYADFLPARMDSIYDQFYPLNEVLVLDDCSPDNSLEVLEKYREETKRQFTITPNEKNSGSGYRQWDKGTQLARSEFVWVAEADDIAEPEFLDEAMEMLESTDTAFVFCDSSQRDEHDNPLADSYRYYFNTLEDGAFNQSFLMEGEEFVRRFLSIKNIIMNVSGVVWRKSAFLAALEATRAHHETMRVASDWKMYAYAALNCGKVGFVAKSLNMHRRHSASVTHSRKAEQHYKEITDVQEYIASRVILDKKQLEDREAYRKEVQAYLGLTEETPPPQKSADATQKKRKAG